jgi:hypothetical protein
MQTEAQSLARGVATTSYPSPGYDVVTPDHSYTEWLRRKDSYMLHSGVRCSADVDRPFFLEV